MKTIIFTILMAISFSSMACNEKPSQDEIDANMMWDNNLDFHELNTDADEFNSNMEWHDDGEFQTYQ